jgi:hypothetical protein
MVFTGVPHVGASLLASAGIVGVIAGIAAQKTVSNLLAGFQTGVAQPMRQDDVVIVEGEWGRVEEITPTSVVVHLWNERRLALPLSYFIEKPFQNWTCASARLLGSVFVWVDYSLSGGAGTHRAQGGSYGPSGPAPGQPQPARPEGLAPWAKSPAPWP